MVPLPEHSYPSVHGCPSLIRNPIPLTRSRRGGLEIWVLISKKSLSDINARLRRRGRRRKGRALRRYSISSFFGSPSDIPGPCNGPSGAVGPVRLNHVTVYDLLQVCDPSGTRLLVHPSACSTCTYPASTAYTVEGKAGPYPVAPPQ